MASTDSGVRPRLSEQVAEEIRALLGRKRWSGRELARRMGASPSWVNFRLTGAQPISLDDLQRIADVLDVDVLDLIPTDLKRPRVGNSGTVYGQGGQTTVPSVEQPKRPVLTGQPKRAVPPSSTRRPVKLTPMIPELMTDERISTELLPQAA